MNTPANIVTIAGSDSGGGAGIQADLKTISALGGFGMSVITALTAQNGLGVTGIHAPDPGFVALQLNTVLEGFPLAAAKTGMLFSADIIDALADILENKDFPLVVDPVSVSQSGYKLMEDDAVAALESRILPLADLLTPNVPEAELLTGMTIASADDVPEAMKILLAKGPKAVLIKGGHMEQRPEQVTDWLGQRDGSLLTLSQPRHATEHTHGTGCTLSAAIATGLGQGLPLEAAVRRGQRYLNLCLSMAYAPGKGYGPPYHMAPCDCQGLD